MDDAPDTSLDPDLPPPEDRAWLIEHLAIFLERGGLEPFVAAPLLEPTAKWFPDRWVPDLEGARTQLLRLLSYAQLDSLDVVVRLFTHDDWSPPQLAPGLGTTKRETSGAAALFAGIHEGVAYFGVDRKQLERPEGLIGVLAHEVAHAWRRSHGVEFDGRDVEERMTDLTTIGLGFGIVTTNAAYLYRSEAVGRAYQWSHSHAGYLSFPAMSFLLAAQCLVRDADSRRLERQLETSQRASFRAALDALQRKALLDALRLPPESEWPEARPEAPAKLPRRLSVVQRAVREAGAHFDESADRPLRAPDTVVPCAFDIMDCRRRGLGLWGAFDTEAPWSCGMALVEDPQMQFHIVAARFITGDGTIETVAYGAVPDSVVKQPRKLRAALEPLFDANGCASHPLFRELPTYYQFSTPLTLDLDDMRELVLRAAPRFDLAQLAAAVTAYQAHLREPMWRARPDSRETVDALRCAPRADGSRVPLDRETTRVLRSWWSVITQPGHLDHEFLGVRTVWDRRERAAREAAALSGTAAVEIGREAGETRQTAEE